MITEINETIKVGAIFGDNKKKLKPVWFIWSSRKYLVRKLPMFGRKGWERPSCTILRSRTALTFFHFL